MGKRSNYPIIPFSSRAFLNPDFDYPRAVGNFIDQTLTTQPVIQYLVESDPHPAIPTISWGQPPCWLWPGSWSSNLLLATLEPDPAGGLIALQSKPGQQQR